MIIKTLFAGLLVIGIAALSAGGSLPPAAPAAPAPPGGGVCWDSLCYRTYDDALALMQSTAAAYPQLVALSDFGTSWEGSRRLTLARLGNAAMPASRPTLYIVAEQHPRDITTPEMLLRFMAYLTGAYGSDPEVTWLLDNRWIYLLPLVNPDGYNRVYSDAQCSRIKNTDNANGCSSYLSAGTDLNRNFPFHWNLGGASNQPCDSSYPGPSALSEPESAALLTSIVASSPGLVLQLSAPGAGAGQSIRYPWGWSVTPPPDAAGLDALAWGMARLNGTQRSAVTQHNHGAGTLISGILDDTVYGQYGVPALTLNIGDAPSATCATLDTLWQAQRPALLYAAAVTGDSITETLSRPFGPSVDNLLVSSGPLPNTLTATATLSSNAGTVEGAVYSLDRPGPDGSGVAMSGNFGGGTANVTGTIDLSALPNGRHVLFVQGRNNDNRWGILASTFFTVAGNPTATATSLVTTPTRTPTSAFSPSVTPSPPATRSASSTATSIVTATPTRTRTLTVTPTQQAGCNTGLYAATGLPAPIPNAGVLTSTLVVNSPGLIADLDLTNLTIYHQALGDLTGSLTSPDDTTITLFDSICGHTADMQGITLDDGALRAIGEVCPPIANTSYQPQPLNPLSTFNGRPAAGTWTLTIRDNIPGESGDLLAWGLRIATGSSCLTPTSTRTSTLVPTQTATGTPQRTATLTYTLTPTRTPTLTHSPTLTRTPTLTHTATFTHTPTPTRTTTSTRIATGTFTPRPPVTATPLECAAFTDVHPSQFFYVAVEWLTCRNIISGYSDNTFRPSNNATRAQIVKMIVAGEGWLLFAPAQPTFSDVQPSDWFYAPVETAYKHGIIGGYGDGTFRPYNDVTRGQLSKLIVLARLWSLLDPDVGHFSDVPRGSAFYAYVETAQAHGVVSGYGDVTFRPQQNATRGQLSKMLYTALTQEPGP